ncbi:MAG: hypothetical protein LBD10_07500 [Desulfobulbus sp.]|jgi:hypothetical protein|uniref:hypothetical protein n=1 Tax=Desulfobulbus sp. TaxID=895 RepID=UPI00284AE042|nr:hypothetical protein [Desulfobulbus sp.]MDR2550023.1 hypothetical protein [Desulfobulbus sp.]
MATYRSVVCSTVNQFLVDLAAFLVENGWAIDLDGTYSGSYRRLHFHKGAAHFDLYSSSSNRIYAHACLGYAAANAPGDQPGRDPISSASRFFTVYPGYNAHLISVAGALYIGALNTYGVPAWSFFIHDPGPDRFGNWNGGAGIVCGCTSGLCNSSMSNNNYATVYINNAWTPTGTTAAGSIIGLEPAADLAARHQPFFYNQTVMPIQILVGLRNASDASKYHPLFFLPGARRGNGGTIYDIGEILVIGGEDYKIIPNQTAAIGSTSYGDYLFKLGN